MGILDSALSTRRSLLSAFWLVTNLFVVGAIIAGTVTSHRYYKSLECVCDDENSNDNNNADYNGYYDYDGNNNNYNAYNYNDCDECQEEERDEEEQNVKTNALIFSASWVLLNLIFVSFCGTIFVTGVGCGPSYRECLSANVLGRGGQDLRLGMFVGALLWTSSMLIENAVVFGLFNVGHDERGGPDQEVRKSEVINKVDAKQSRSYSSLLSGIFYSSLCSSFIVQDAELLQDKASYAFAIMCLLAAIGYASVATVVLLFREDLVGEFVEGTGLSATPGTWTATTIGASKADKIEDNNDAVEDVEEKISTKEYVAPTQMKSL